MDTRVLTLAVLGGLVLLLAACDLHGDTDPSLLSASYSVTAAQEKTEGEYRGSGFFGTTKQRRYAAPIPDLFYLHSGGYQGSTGKSFTFYGPDDQRPEEGVYVIGEDTGFKATFQRRHEGTWQIFSAQAGEIEITLSSPDRVEGRFHFSGSLSHECDMAGTGSMMCVLRDEVDASITLEASGHFEAVPRQVSLMMW